MSCGYVACKECRVCEGFCQDAATTHSYHEMVHNALNSPDIPTSIIHDDIVIKELPKELYNAIVVYLNIASSFGNKVDSGAYIADEISGNFLTAAGIDSLIRHFNGPGQLKPRGVAPVIPGEVIYADYIRILMIMINNAQFASTACHMCNVNCETCVTMVTENSCSNCCNSR